MAKFCVVLRSVHFVDTSAIPAAELRDMLNEYEPTPEEPKPDAEWYAEEWAMRQVANATEVEVSDCYPVRESSAW